MEASNAVTATRRRRSVHRAVKCGVPRRMTVVKIILTIIKTRRVSVTEAVSVTGWPIQRKALELELNRKL